MSRELLLFSISIIPVILIGLYVYKKDKNKESKIFLIKLFFGGIGSGFIVLFLNLLFSQSFSIFTKETTSMDRITLLIYTFLCIALIEEFSKWIILYIMSYNNEDFDELYDIIIYSVFVALGFAFFENLFYVYQSGVGVGIIRAVLSVPGHSCNGVIMGYYLGLFKISSLNKNRKLRTKNIIYSILFPTVTHGIYDFCLLSNKLIFIAIFLIFIICIYIYVIKKIKKISNINSSLKV